jgi:small subunit ribosomal protein S21
LIKVIINEKESIEKALKKFKRKVEQSVILKELRKREFFLKPSIKKKLKERAAYARSKKREKRLSNNFFS